MAKSVIKQDPSVNGLIPKLIITNSFGSALPINIDTINNPNGYIFRVVQSSGLSGTSPLGILGGTAFLLIGFSEINTDTNLPKYGVQIAIGFRSPIIVIRRAGYDSEGTAWGAWKTINST